MSVRYAVQLSVETHPVESWSKTSTTEMNVYQTACAKIGGCFKGTTEEQVQFRVNFCTEDYLSGKCLDVCRETRDPGGGSLLTPCDGGPTNASSLRWCCGTSNACCQNLVDVITLPHIFQGLSLYTTSVSSVAPTTVTLTVSPSTEPSEPTTSAQAQDQDSSSLSTGVKAGIGTGAAAGVIGAVIAALVVFRSHRRKKQSYQPSGTGFSHYSKDYTPNITGQNQQEFDSTPIAELQAMIPPPTELPGEVPSDPNHSKLLSTPTTGLGVTKPGPQE